MSMPLYYTTDEVYSETYFQLPQILFTSPRYKPISNDAKVAYALLKDRFNYSVKNNWVDQNNRIYFIFTNTELMELLQVANKKLIRVKKELEDVGLLTQHRQGVNKPNRLYLLRPVVEATDVYMQTTPQTLATSGSVKMTLPKIDSQTPQTLATSGSVKMTLPKIDSQTPQTLAMSGSVKMTHNQYKDSLDTLLDKNKDTNNLDFSSFNFSKDQLDSQNQDLVKNSRKFLKDGTHELFLSEEAIHLLEMWCNTPQQMRKIIGIILNAKNAVCKDNDELGVYFNLEEEELQEKILNTLRRYFNAIRTKEKAIGNYENYLYGTMVNMFEQYWNEQAFASLKS